MAVGIFGGGVGDICYMVDSALSSRRDGGLGFGQLEAAVLVWTRHSRWFTQHGVRQARRALAVHGRLRADMCDLETEVYADTGRTRCVVRGQTMHTTGFGSTLGEDA